MKLSDFDYELPSERIAQEPLEPRDRARLLVHEVASARTQHRAIRDLDQLLTPGDLLIVNDTRVRAARFLGRRKSGGAVELLLAEPLGDGVWRTLVQPAGRMKPGEELELEGGALRARMLERPLHPLPSEAGGSGAPGAPGEWRVALLAGSQPASDVDLERTGRVPLPPYIRRDALERDRAAYQTVYARELGAIAAPTAGLHFTPELLARLEACGVERASLTLHVGEGTFRPVASEDVREHRMHAERYELPQSTADAVARCRERGGRVIAVGTTSARVLETLADERGRVRAARGETDIFLLPPYRFRAVDALLTNFHLPRSTLLMLVSAFAGRERTLALYREAIELGYRFYSYGDAMLIVGGSRRGEGE